MTEFASYLITGLIALIIILAFFLGFALQHPETIQ